MRTGLWPTVALVLPFVALGIWLGSVFFAGGDEALRNQLKAQADSVARATLAYEALSEKADSLEAETRVRVDTFTSYVTRWRTRTDTLTVPELVTLADSTINACESALLSCVATVEAKDSALSASEARADLLAEYNEDLSERLLKTESRRKWRDLLMGGIGGSIGFTVCSLTH